MQDILDNKVKFYEHVYKDKSASELCNYIKTNFEIDKRYEQAKNQPREHNYITCIFCSSKLVDINVKQIRSGDEGSTMIIKCLECKRISKKN